ncbi:MULTISPECIES: bacterioferritin [Salinicola]|uniref:bacterioferritin n=1 Tax=Salinicola TaxID=404432 RepID=UPI000DA1F788|nr:MULTISPECIES: bacterioferritin [Salinicola]
MKGDPQVIAHLNTVLGNELVAINQYFLHAKMYKNWGLSVLAKWEYDESIEEMQHADRLTDRILHLEGMPNLQDLGKLQIGENAKEMLECDLRIEQKACADLKAAIDHCETVNDYVTCDMLIKILEDEEGHINKLEAELKLIDQVGIQNYLQKHMFATDKE